MRLRPTLLACLVGLTQQIRPYAQVEVKVQEDYDDWNYYGSDYEYGSFQESAALYELAQLPKQIATDCRGKNAKKKQENKWEFVALITNGAAACNGIWITKEYVVTNAYCCTSLDDSQKTIYVRTTTQSIRVKFFVNLRQANQCILKLENNNHKPKIPCFPDKVNTFPAVSQSRPNCYMGGWAHENTHFTSGWALYTEHVQQVRYAECEEGLGTPIKEDELCVVSTGVMPAPSIETCSIFTGIPLICFDESNIATVHGIAAWPAGCAIPGIEVGIWSQLTKETLIKLMTEVERYKQAKKEFYSKISLKMADSGEIDIDYEGLEEIHSFTYDPYKNPQPFLQDLFTTDEEGNFILAESTTSTTSTTVSTSTTTTTTTSTTSTTTTTTTTTTSTTVSEPEETTRVKLTPEQKEAKKAAKLAEIQARKDAKQAARLTESTTASSSAENTTRVKLTPEQKEAKKAAKEAEIAARKEAKQWERIAAIASASSTATEPNSVRLTPEQKEAKKAAKQAEIMARKATKIPRTTSTTSTTTTTTTTVSTTTTEQSVVLTLDETRKTAKENQEIKGSVILSKGDTVNSLDINLRNKIQDGLRETTFRPIEATTEVNSLLTNAQKMIADFSADDKKVNYPASYPFCHIFTLSVYRL